MQKVKWAAGLSLVLTGVILAVGQNCSKLEPTLVQEDSATPGWGGGGGGGGTSPGTSSSGTVTPGTSSSGVGSNAPTIPTSTTDACAPTITPPSGVSGKLPTDLRSYADLNHIAACGDGITVAVIISAGTSNITADLNTYSTAMGLPAITSSNFQIMMPDGSCSTSVTPLEAHIDTEMVHALAPNAKIIMACGSDNSSAARGRAIEAAIAAGATIVSMSWGAPESSADSSVLEPIFQAHTDVTFFAGSGDSGSNDSNGVPRVAYPASSPEVIAVGATADTGGENLTAWANSGGGISTLFTRPTWQASLTAAFPGTMRLVPDIAFNGSNTTPTAVYGAAGWTLASGTSVASPIAAGMMAIINQIYARSLGDIHAKLYALYPNNQLTYFRDVVTGNNGDYNAGVGYDLLSGLGSPRARALIPLLQ